METALIQINKRLIGNTEVNSVDAKELYQQLGLDKSNWARWSKVNIVDNTFAIEHDDYEGFVLWTNGNEVTNYALAIPFAKKLAMQVKTTQGEKVRNYFLKCEEIAMEQFKPKELTRLDILEIAIQSEKERIRAIAARDEALLTKAFISDKKTATALATASAAVRERNKVLKENEILKEQIGDSQNYKQVKSIPFLKDYFTLNLVAYQQIGRALAKISKEKNIPVKMIPDSTYGEVKAYHIDVIDEFKNKLDGSNLLANYRK